MYQTCDLAHATGFPDGVTGATARREFAATVYRAACDAGGINSVDWQAIAGMLFDSMPKPKAAPLGDPLTTWIDYDVPRRAKVVWPRHILQVAFADGTVTRANAMTIAGKPINWGRGVRLAISRYRFKVGGFAAWKWDSLDVPRMTAIVVEGTDIAFPAAIANDETRELRRNRFDGATIDISHRLLQPVAA